MIKKILPKSIDQSIRLSCAKLQKPFEVKIGNFVVMIETSIMMISGILAYRVSNPTKTKVPQVISNTPTKFARNSGEGSPILANRPAPNESANKNF